MVQPGDTRYLAPDNSSTFWYDVKLKAMKQAAKPYFWWKRRPKKIKGSDSLTAV